MCSKRNMRTLPILVEMCRSFPDVVVSLRRDFEETICTSMAGRTVGLGTVTNRQSPIASDSAAQDIYFP